MYIYVVLLLLFTRIALQMFFHNNNVQGTMKIHYNIKAVNNNFCLRVNNGKNNFAQDAPTAKTVRSICQAYVRMHVCIIKNGVHNN